MERRKPISTAARTAEQSWLDWMEMGALVAGAAGTLALLALLVDTAHAQPPTPRPGFPSGARPFGGNPFANTPNAPGGDDDDFFDEEDEEDFDFPDDAPMGGPPAGANAGGGSPGGGNRGGDGISMGGGTPGNVISNTNVGPLRVDDETGEGSKEIVTDFNFPDADIMDIAKTLGKLTGKNFIYDKDVKGRITIVSNSPITVGDAWKAFLTALDVNGFALIPSGKYIRIARQRDARDKQLKTYTGEKSPDSDSLITRVFQLKYIDAEEVARTFRSFMPANSRIIPYGQTNTVIVTDTGSNIAKLNKMLEILDVEGYDAGIEVIPVKYASSAELSKLIDQLLPGTGGAPGQPGAPRFGGGSSRFNARRTKEGGIINTIISDDRTNTLIVHANIRGADQVRALVSKLDKKQPVPAGGGKVHVVPLQFADAEAIAQTLNNLSQSGGSPFRPISPAGGGGTGTNPVAASLFEGSIKVSPDKATNSLVITASPNDFITIHRVIARLDIPRDEVYVEVVIMEITLGRNFNYSANLANPVNGVFLMPNTDIFDFIANPQSQRGAILNWQTAGKQTFNIGGKDYKVGNVTALVKAIQSNSNANILATPQIIALDNTEASFVSSEKIPVPVSTAVQGAGVSTSISKESVELSIKIKPQINKVTSFVKLEVDAKLGAISDRPPPAQVQGLAFATLERNAKTSVVVGDADTVVIGGLMRDQVNESVSKVPVLGDIPLLGWLFRAKNTSIEKTNLLIFLTPHIVRQYEKVRAILDRKLKERDDFIENAAGGNDTFRPERDKIIRGLPDLKKLQEERYQSVATIDDEPAAAGGLPFNKSRKQDEPNTAPTVPAAPAVPVDPEMQMPIPETAPQGDPDSAMTGGT